MKQHLTLLIALAAAFQLNAADTLTLDLGTALFDYNQTEDGYWDGTYSDTDIETPYFIFSHKGEQDNGAMAYWEGFTICTSGDRTDYGTEGSSDAWITHQWGCMAGGGLNEDMQVEEGRPYMVAYWGFFYESMDDTYHSLRINFADGKAHKAVGVWICNHPWPYYGNINGDGFATAFTNEGDYFALVAHGLNEKGEPTGSKATIVLASYSNGGLNQSDQWQYMDLSPLGTVNGIYFTMETTDTDILNGANTAVYFCLDRLQIEEYVEQTEALCRPSGLKTTDAGETEITLSWNRTENADWYELYLDGTYAGQTSDTFFVFTGLLPLTEYTLSVEAASDSHTSEAGSVTASTLDLTAPSIPAELTAVPNEYSITVSWQPSTDNVAVRRYTVYVDGEPIRRTAETSFTISPLDPNTEYTISVEAEDTSGNKSDTAVITVSTLGITALTDITAGERTSGYYTVSGQYIGTTQPKAKGVYITRHNKQPKIIN